MADVSDTDAVLEELENLHGLFQNVRHENDAMKLALNSLIKAMDKTAPQVRMAVTNALETKHDAVAAKFRTQDAANDPQAENTDCELSALESLLWTIDPDRREPADNTPTLKTRADGLLTDANTGIPYAAPIDSWLMGLADDMTAAPNIILRLYHHTKKTADGQLPDYPMHQFVMSPDRAEALAHELLAYAAQIQKERGETEH